MSSLQMHAITAVRRTLRALVPLLPARRTCTQGSKPIGPHAPPRILLLHPGHLGDLVISTSILQPLEEHFPGAEIGFVAASWARTALEGVAGIRRVHTLDHWRLNRGLPGLAGRWVRYWKTRAAAVREIRAQQYDIALCLLDVNPDLLDVAWSANIPVRVGWSSSYFTPLATHLAVTRDGALEHQAVRQAHILDALGVARQDPATLRSRVVEDSSESLLEVCAALQLQSLAQVRYTVIHMGAGAPMKQMPIAFWRYIAAALSQSHVLLFTGRGEAEQQAIREVIEGLPNCFDACNRLSWRGFVSAIRSAETLYGVDSMAGHVAAAVGTPVIAAYQGAGGVARWRPLQPNATVFTRHLPCAPCLVPAGCAGMPCKDIRPEWLLSASPAVTSGDSDNGLAVHAPGLELTPAL